VDTGNASAVETALLDAYEQHGALSLDANELEYVSSAGLRVFLELRKKQGRLEVFNVSPEVWDIFDVTGFSDLLEVRKQFRQISVEGCELIGKGGNGSVYRISDDEIIKVYTAKTPLSSIEGERERARSAFVAGVPTAIPYDVVKVGDSYGIIFEMVKADVIARKFMNEPEHYDEYAQKYANLFKEIHSVSLAGKGLPATSTLYLADIDRMADWYDEKELERLRWFVRQIPQRDTMVHGDFHTNNVMVQGDELLIIDMAEISCGHPIFDLAASYFVHMLNPIKHPSSVMEYLNVTPEIAMDLWSVMIRHYFGTEDQAAIHRYNEIIEGFCMLKMALTPAIWVNMPDQLKQRSVNAARERFFPRMEYLLEDLGQIFA
jgi:uncharacterized protein (TIGR02172 family)